MNHGMGKKYTRCYWFCRFCRQGQAKPLLPEEVRFILKQMGLKEKTIDVELEVGEQVRIKSGPFANQVGEVQEIETDKFKLTVLVDMFGRETPVEVEFDQ